MVLEVMLIDVLPGRADDFLNAYQLARPIIAGAPGCRSIRVQRGAESANRFMLLVEWDSIAAHEQNFRHTERFAQWRALIASALAQPPVAEFFTDVAPAGNRPDPDHDFFAA
ncbi:antibiotic biosynthesis monooxygenase [Actinoplanes sp. DH11]|uniref:antibiotic biosynthesis monooxygenase family protein n=1 Tax=Actinoplanes sp. DH11 TaxID=2857011 RepID=UPI001E352A09|nr:antibiotic biosynthesis monooxygenase family protein [Actinoplanes sp. DH11]